MERSLAKETDVSRSRQELFSNNLISHVEVLRALCIPVNTLGLVDRNFVVNDLVELKGILSDTWSCTAVWRYFVGSEHSLADVGDAVDGNILPCLRVE